MVAGGFPNASSSRDRGDTGEAANHSETLSDVVRASGGHTRLNLVPSSLLARRIAPLSDPFTIF